MLDMLPPSAVEVEESLIASCINSNEMAVEAVDLLSPEQFYKTANRKIFSAIQSLVKSKSPVTLSSVVNVLRDMNFLEEVGGAVFVQGFLDAIPVAPNVAYSAKVVRGKADLRRLIEISNHLSKACFEPGAEPESVIDDAQSMVNDVAIGRKESSFTHVSTVMASAIERCEALEQHGGVTGVPTGYMDFDGYTCGFQQGDLIIIAGRPSMGKTALALNCARNQAIRGDKVAVFSMEMPNPRLGIRFLSMQSHVNSNKFRSGKFAPGDWNEIHEAAAKISKWGLYIDDTASQSYQKICRKARQIHNQEQIDIIYLDYLGFIDGDRRDTSAKEVESITRALKSLAKELNIPVVLLVQLNRKCEERNDKRPVLSDLRDSGAIEQDADLVVFIYRHEKYLKQFVGNKINPDWEKWRGVAEILIRKQRDGPTGEFSLTFQDTYTRFENYTEMR